MQEVGGSNPPSPTTLTWHDAWLIPLVDQDRAARRQIRQLEHDIDSLLDEHGTTLVDACRFGVDPPEGEALLVEIDSTLVEIDSTDVLVVGGERPLLDSDHPTPVEVS